MANKSVAVVKRTSAGLADALFEELDSLRSGDTTPQAARAKSAIANTIVQIKRLEMEYSRFCAYERNAEGPETETAPRAIPAIELGGGK